MARQRQTFIAETSGSETMTRHSKAIGTFLGTLLLAAGLSLGLGAQPALAVGDVVVPPAGSFTLPEGVRPTRIALPSALPTISPLI